MVFICLSPTPSVAHALIVPAGDSSARIYPADGQNMCGSYHLPWQRHSAWKPQSPSGFCVSGLACCRIAVSVRSAAGESGTHQLPGITPWRRRGVAEMHWGRLGRHLHVWGKGGSVGFPWHGWVLCRSRCGRSLLRALRLPRDDPVPLGKVDERLTLCAVTPNGLPCVEWEIAVVVAPALAQICINGSAKVGFHWSEMDCWLLSRQRDRFSVLRTVTLPRSRRSVCVREASHLAQARNRRAAVGG